MLIERAGPPRILRRSYGGIVAAVIAASGEWVRIHADGISGANKGTKAAKLHSLAYRHGLRFQTTAADGFIYVRIRQQARPAS